MTLFCSLFDNSERDIFDTFFREFGFAEQERKTEWQSAITLQAFWRRCKVQKDIEIFNQAATSIQRCWRGYNARKCFRLLVIERDHLRRMSFFNKAATLIQKNWRGYRSRLVDEKTLHSNPDGLINNFKVRKRVIQELLEKGKKAVQQSAENVERMRIEQEQELQTRQEQSDLAKRLKMRHMVKTKAIPSALPEDEEVIIKTLAKESLTKRNSKSDTFTSKQNSSNSSFLPPIVSVPTDTVKEITHARTMGTKTVPQGPFPSPYKIAYLKNKEDSQTIRRSEQYGHEKTLEKEKSAQDRAMWISPNNFVPYRSTAHEDTLPHISKNTEYVQKSYLFTGEGVSIPLELATERAQTKKKDIANVPFVSTVRPVNSFSEFSKDTEITAYALKLREQEKTEQKK